MSFRSSRLSCFHAARISFFKDLTVASAFPLLCGYIHWGGGDVLESPFFGEILEELRCELGALATSGAPVRQNTLRREAVN